MRCTPVFCCWTSVFILYVNDLPSYVSSDAKLFADNTAIFERLPGSNVNAVTQSVTFGDIWMKANKLKCNINKSKSVISATSSSLLDLFQLDIVIKAHLNNCEVGIYECLSFKDQIHNLKTKLLFCNYIVLHSKALLTRTQLLIYYRTYVEPILQYGVLVYSCTAYCNLHEIFNVQKRMIRSICFLPKHANVTDYLSEHELPTVYEVHIRELFKFVLTCIREEDSHKSLNENKIPKVFKYSLRSMDRLESSVPFGYSKKFNHSLAKRIPKFYKNLSTNGILPDIST